MELWKMEEVRGEIKIKDVNGYKELPLGNLPLGNILYLCGVKQ